VLRKGHLRVKGLSILEILDVLPRPYVDRAPEHVERCIGAKKHPHFELDTLKT
jgi:hypothetical protein